MAVLADRAEESGGKGSIIGIFQAVTATRFPTTLNGVLCLRFSLDDPEDTDREGVLLEVRFVGPDGATLSSMQMADAVMPVTPLQPLRGVDLTLDLRSVVLPQPGTYRFEIRSDDELRAVVPLSAWLTD
jgi:hypothetical protein